MITDPMHMHHDMGREGFGQRAFEVGDHPPQWKTIPPWWKAFFLGLVWAGLAARVCGGAPEEAQWRCWLEPKFMHSPGAQPIEGARRTELAGGFLTELGLETATSAERDSLGTQWASVFAKGRENAAADLKSVTTEYARNKQRVIEYAIVRSEKGLVASAVLAPKFLEQFAETLGPTVLLVVPNRGVAYVFPKLASHYQELAPEVLEAYRNTHWPVSLEVFELGPGGALKSVGAYADPARD
jgi:hypothetical protein